jgi:hypothetical protein
MLQPKVNKWYQDAETMELFEVIDINDDLVDIQYANGLITEFSLDDWHQLHLLPAAQPEDWSLAWDLSEEDKGQVYHQEELHPHKQMLIDEEDDDGFHTLSEEIDDYNEADDL